MFRKNPVAVGLTAAVTVILVGCGSTSATSEPDPVSVKPIAGSEVQQIQLTDQAIDRLGITTRPVRVATMKLSPQLAKKKVIPYSAVVYHTDGSTWTFVNTAARTFVRQPITVTTIHGSTAVLAKGPAVGTQVVTVGAPELLGAEYDISGE